MAPALNPLLASNGITVYRIRAGSNVFLLETDAALYLVDAGIPGCEKKILAALEQLKPKPLKLIFITHAHFDHYGSAAALHRATNAPIAIHRADAAAMTRGETPLRFTRNGGAVGKLLLPVAYRLWKPRATVADVTCADGDSLETFGLDATVVHTGGHTPGSCCLFVRGRLLFAGDLVIAHLRFHRQRFFAWSWEGIDRGIATIRSLSPEAVFPGHGRGFLTGSRLNVL